MLVVHVLHKCRKTYTVITGTVGMDTINYDAFCLTLGLPFQNLTVFSMLLGVRCISFGGVMLQSRLSSTLIALPIYHNSE